jgi:hypothetical protein
VALPLGDEEVNGVASASSDGNWLDAQALSVDYVAAAHSGVEEGRGGRGGRGASGGGGGGEGSPYSTEAKEGVRQGLSLDYEDDGELLRTRRDAPDALA